MIPAIGINPKAEEAVMVFRERGGALEVEIKNLRKAKAGAATDVVIRAGGLEARYWVYLGDAITLSLYSTNPEEVMKAAHLLRLAGVKAEVGKRYHKRMRRYEWYIQVTTDRLADKTVDAGLREKLAEAVLKAAEGGLIKREMAERWAEKLREGITVVEDMPKFKIRITTSGSLVINYRTTSAERPNKYAEALRRLGLEEGVHFIAKEPKDGEEGRLAIAVEGVKKLADLSMHAGDESTRIEAARWVDHLLARARESGGEEARRRVEELAEEGRARGAYMLTGLRREVEVDGERHVVEVREVKAWIDDAGKLRIWVKAVVDSVEVEREFRFGRYNNSVRCYLKLRTSAPGGREADRKRFDALSVVLFGDRPGTASGGKQLAYTRHHLEHAMRYGEIKDVAEKWFSRALATPARGD